MKKLNNFGIDIENFVIMSILHENRAKKAKKERINAKK